MLDGARACWLGARCTEKSGDLWLLRYGRLDTNFAAGRRSYVANLVQFSSESAPSHPPLLFYMSAKSLQIW